MPERRVTGADAPPQDQDATRAAVERDVDDPGFFQLERLGEVVRCILGLDDDVDSRAFVDQAVSSDLRIVDLVQGLYTHGARLAAQPPGAGEPQKTFGALLTVEQLRQWPVGRLPVYGRDFWDYLCSGCGTTSATVSRHCQKCGVNGVWLPAVPASGGSTEPEWDHPPVCPQCNALMWGEAISEVGRKEQRCKTCGHVVAPEPSAPAPCPVREAAQRWVDLPWHGCPYNERQAAWDALTTALSRPCAGRAGAPRKEELGC